MRLPFPESFSSEVEQVAVALADVIERRVADELRAPHPVFTLDHPDTHDFDDAISAQFSGDGRYLHCKVCVSHPGPELAPGSLVFEEAQRRGASIYLPDRVVPMLPAILSEDVLSLKQGRVRQALCLEFVIPSAPALWVPSIEYSLHVHPVRVIRNVLYGHELPTDFPAALMYQWSDWRRRIRSSAGAVILPRVRTRPAKGQDGRVALCVTERDDAEHRMIEELMIFFNSCVAEWCFLRSVPCLYRSSEPYRNPEQVALWLCHADQALARSQVFRHAGRAITSLVPTRHHTVGVDRYTQATSPVRRFSDVLVHAAVGASLRGVSSLPGPAMLARFRASEAGSEAGRRLTRHEERLAFQAYYGGLPDQNILILVPRRASANDELDAVVADQEIPVRLRTRLPVAAGDRVVARWVEVGGDRLVFQAI